MSTRYNKSPYTARSMLRSSPLRRTTVKHICWRIQKEIQKICSTKFGDSVLRDTSVAAVTRFSWKPLLEELKEHAPTLYAIIRAALRRAKRKVEHSAIGIVASTILKLRNRKLSQPQAVISTLLYGGHCSKQVSKHACTYVKFFVGIK